MVAALVTVMAAQRAQAQVTEGSGDPWAAGVPPERRATALRLFRLGNGFFENARYAEALRHYRDAIRSWDHPAIRFNMAVCLVNLDDPLGAHYALEGRKRARAGRLSR